MSSRAFRLMVVADDRKILRRLSRFLTGFGFVVETIADGEVARALYEAAPPDFLIVDGDGPALQHCRPIFSEKRNRYTHTFLMASDFTMEELTDALESGVDDFLAKPLIFGELLARLRSGARVLEYERRMREQAAVDRVTSLLSRSAFRERLQNELDSEQAVACVLLSLDYFDTLTRLHGHGASDDVLQAVTKQIKSLAGDCKFLASFGTGRFAAMLPNTSEATVLAWAENLREGIANLAIPLEYETISLTASIGVAGSTPETPSADALIRRAEDAVRLAESSGHNCVARGDQYDGETREWEDLARQGRLFDTTVARDVMVPCHLFVRTDHDLQYATKLLKRSHLSEIPVVDRHGMLAGLFNAEQLPGDIGGIEVRDVMVENMKTVTEDENFDSLMEFFMADVPSNHVAIVVRRNKPLGMIYRSGLAALSQPLTDTSFTPNQPFSASSNFLLVPDTCPAV